MSPMFDTAAKTQRVASIAANTEALRLKNLQIQRECSATFMKYADKFAAQLVEILHRNYVNGEAAVGLYYLAVSKGDNYQDINILLSSLRYGHTYPELRTAIVDELVSRISTLTDEPSSSFTCEIKTGPFTIGYESTEEGFGFSLLLKK